ncbi:MAG: AAA family ATPase [Spirochaetes bacterium]|nr:AAA family ATPase [Spirochaetota bacterium]
MGNEEVVLLIENNKQVILYGPPGTGKTYNARKIAIELIEKHFSENSGGE